MFKGLVTNYGGGGGGLQNGRGARAVLTLQVGEHSSCLHIWPIYMQ